MAAFMFFILEVPSFVVAGNAGLSGETIDRLMDYIEKYLMVRLYRIMFCSYLTDDEERDLAMQTRIRSLHWITSHLLDTALDESNDDVRDLLDSAITGEFTLGTASRSLKPLQAVGFFFTEFRAFSAFTLLVGWQESIRPVKTE